MVKLLEQTFNDYYLYPPVGDDDWAYGFATGLVRALETRMLTKGAIADMANAENFEAAVEMLGGSEYSLERGGKNFAEIEQMLLSNRASVRKLFSDVMIDERIAELFRTREDFSNMRLAMRRMLTEKPIGIDYSDGGNIQATLIEEAFSTENYGILPDYMQEIVEEAVLAYYQQKDIRQIDYILDDEQAKYNLQTAEQMGNIFLCGLFRIVIDLTNIRTMMRLKFRQAENGSVFLKDGFLEIDRLKYALESGYETLGQLFFVTPYHRLVEAGSAYLSAKKSFLILEHLCDEHLAGFLATTNQIIAGPQPVIAYLLMKEQEIRMVRLILTSKKNNLDKQLILERTGK